MGPSSKLSLQSAAEVCTEWHSPKGGGRGDQTHEIDGHLYIYSIGLLHYDLFHRPDGLGVSEKTRHDIDDVPKRSRVDLERGTSLRYDLPSQLSKKVEGNVRRVA